MKRHLELADQRRESLDLPLRQRSALRDPGDLPPRKLPPRVRLRQRGPVKRDQRDEPVVRVDVRVGRRGSRPRQHRGDLLGRRGSLLVHAARYAAGAGSVGVSWCRPGRSRSSAPSCPRYAAPTRFSKSILPIPADTANRASSWVKFLTPSTAAAEKRCSASESRMNLAAVASKRSP